MRLLGTKLAANSSHRGFGDQLYDLAGERPSLDLNFANQKSLVDATTGRQLIDFTRASSATFVDSDGLIKTATTNLLLRSEEFNDAYWTKSATSITANDIASPVGTITADKLVEDSANSQHTIGSQSISWLGNTQYTFTLYAKAAGRDTFDLLLGTAGNWVNSNRVAIFNLTSGVVEFQDGSPVSASIQNIGGGWFRCRVTATTVASPSASAVFLRLYDKSTATGGLGSYQGNGSSGVHLWGAQLEQSSTVGEYIPTTSTINSAPRFDHNPTTGESLGLLVEESRTNLLQRSEEFDNVYWTKGGSTISANSATAPDGLTTADKLVEDTSTGNHRLFVATTSLAANTAHSLSVYVKAAGRSFIRVEVRDSVGAFAAQDFNLTTLAVASAGSGSGTIVPLGNGWYRCTATGTSSASGGLGTVLFWSLVSAGSTSYTGDGSSGLFLWGAQLEAGSFPTSYIPTTTATATRSADVASISGSNFSSWYRQDEGTVYGDYIGVSNISGGTRRLVEIGISGGTNDRIVVGYSATTLARMLVVVGGTFPADLTSVAQQGSTVKLAAAFAANDFQLATNSSLSSVDSVGSVPSVSALSLGADFPGAANTNLNGTIRRLCFWPKRLPASSLAAITQ